MASTKRLRSPLDDGDSEAVDVDSAQSSLRHESRKKARVSLDNGDSDGSDDQSDEDGLEEQATQFITEQRKKKKVDNQPADNGILESVTCTNFMCHAYLEVTLGPLINFIIGHNGSGKSAVLTAITICLGGKASATNRGQSLKSFIKEGEESSTLSVKIKNTASSAYQQDVYGDSIIVERQFSRSGTSSFKLKSSTGRLISNRKGDLEEICDYFALQIDNPMNVLTQDMARQFLNNSTPADKYKFFMKGTQLEHLDGDYLQIEQSIDKIDQDLVKQLKDLGVFEEEARKARSLLALSERQDSLRDRIRNLSKQMAWAQVEEQERYVESFEKDLREADEWIAGAERKADEEGGAFASTDKAYVDIENAVKEIRDALAPTQEEKDEVRLQHDRSKAEMIDLRAQQRTIKDHMRAADGLIKKARIDIETEKQRLDDANGGSHTRRLAEIDEKKSDVDVAQTRLKDHENGLGALEEARRQAEAHDSDSQQPLDRKRIEVQTCEGRLSTLMKDRGQRQGAYHNNMPRLLNAIRQEEGFQQQPIGPIGTHVRLLKPIWSSILEKSFGAALNTFIVTSKQDQTRLTALMGKIGCMCPIMIGNNAPLDITGHEPDPSFDTSLRVLELDNDLVRKQLIINQIIEQTLLIESRGEAIDLMSKTRLRNVKQCFTLNIKKGTGIRLNYGYGGNMAEGFIPMFGGVERMKTDTEYQINSQRETLQQLKSEVNSLEQNRRELQKNLTKSKQAVELHRKRSLHLRVELQKAETIVEQLQDALDRDAIEEGRLEALKSHLKEAEEEKTNYEGSYEDAVIAIDKVQESMKTTRDQMTALDVNIADSTAKISKAEARASKLANQRQDALVAKNVALEAVQKGLRLKRVVEEQRQEKINTVANFIAQANEICPRIPVGEGETGETLERKLNQLHKDLKKYEDKIGGDKMRIAESAAKAVGDFQQAQQQVQSIESLSQLLKWTLVNRKERWRHFQRNITGRARLQFLWLLTERGFRGQLRCNHKEKKLELQVEPDETKQSAKGRETKTLSGGEKSFSTICLLLSLWDAMGAPIRCLDEFDVFMDSVNRDVSMRLMVKAARKSVGKQFILITPQSMSSVDMAPDVKIIKMRDPERGQTIINLPAA